MSDKIEVSWVEEIPPRNRGNTSPYDEFAEQVRKNGKVARIKSTKASYSSLAARLRARYEDLDVASRNVGDEYLVFIGPKEEESK